MIEKDRTQNIIIASMIIIAAISGITLASNATYYSGSYMIINNLNIQLTNLQILNYNGSGTPVIRMSFSVQAPTVLAGRAYLNYLRATVYLNGESFSYTEFRTQIPEDKQVLTSGYSELFNISASINDPNDQAIIANATMTGQWTFHILLTYFYNVFDRSRDAVNILAFDWDKGP